MRQTISPNQYGALRFINSHIVPIDFLRVCLNVTIWSLLRESKTHPAYVEKQGTGDRSYLVLTKAGLEAIELYNKATMPRRKEENDLSQKVRQILGLADVSEKHTKAKKANS